MILQILVPPHGQPPWLNCTVSSTDCFISVLQIQQLLLAVFFFFHISTSPRKQGSFPSIRIYLILCDPSAFFNKSDSYITCFCLYHWEAFCVTADTKIFLVWWTVAVWECFAFMTWTCIPGYANGIRLARLNQGWFWNSRRNSQNLYEETVRNLESYRLRFKSLAQSFMGNWTS